MFISDEDQRLLACLRVSDNATKAARLQAFTAHDWQAALDQARRHRLAPYLNWQLNQLGERVQPSSSVRQELHQSALISTSQNMRLLHELRQILNALQAARIPVIVLKGFHLMAMVYPEVALRSMNDLDLLLRPQDFQACDEILLSLGYGPSRQAWIERDDFLTHHHLPPYIKRGVLPVEAHWSIAHPESKFPIDLQGLWARASQVALAGAPGCVLSPEDLLLHLSIHLCHYDRFLKGPRVLVDLLELLRCYGDRLDWEAVLARAQAWQIGKHVYLSLYLSQILLGAPAPAFVLERLQPGGKPVDDWIINQAVQNLFSNSERSSPALNALVGEKTTRQKFSTVLRSVFLTPETLSYKYPVQPGSARLGFFYLLRMRDLLSRHWRRALALWQPDNQERARGQAQLENWLKQNP